MKSTTHTLLFLLLPFFLFSQEVQLELFASGLSSPLGLKHAGDQRLFAVERGGLIKIINSDGTVNGTPYLNISSKVIASGEQGLLGVAFHPQYASNGVFFINYVNTSGNTVIAKYVTNPPNSNTANAASEEILFTVTQPYTNHNGGNLDFGNDGYLYIGLGDGGGSGDPNNNAQNLTTFLGKMLRIDVDNAQGGNIYGIPADNPFPNAANPTALPEIWAYGLRNPWRFSFDSLTQDLWIADVGQNEIEEINRVSGNQAGLNYGWRCYEGNQTYNNSGDCPDTSELTFPIAQYTHNSNGNFKCSITGGYIHRGTLQPHFNGWYFFADYCSNEIGILKNTGSTWNMTFTTPYVGNGWTTFGQDMNGELYIVGIDSGSVFRITDPNLSIVENDMMEISIFPNPASHLFNVKSTNPQILIEAINIYNLQGKLIQSFSENKTSNIQIDTTNLAKGLYLTEIISNTGIKKTHKLIIK
ncbi:MAG: PQQ-dependent sugar dehydrogenase [Xanthomarina sp.]